MAAGAARDRATRVVVTGGAGFIGANLCARLAEVRATTVVAFDNLSTGDARNLEATGVALVVGDILDPDALDRAFAGADHVVHLAARPSVPRSLADPMATHRANAEGTLQVLEAMRRQHVGHVVVASSSSVYGSSPHLPKHEDLATVPLSPYAASKLATEAYALSYSHSFGLDVLALRFFNVFGPLQPAGHAYAAVVPAFVSAAIAGTPLPVHGDGTQTRDFTYVGSVVDVITDAIERRVGHPGPVNLAFGNRVSLLELIELIGIALGRSLDREHLDPRPGDVRDSQGDQTLLRSLFPDIEPVALPAALAETIDWYRRRGR